MQFTFQVGVTEVHLVKFEYGRGRNKVLISVDGKAVETDTFRLWIPRTKHYDFMVGETESHKVSIDASFGRLGAKFRNPHCSASVDGHPVEPAFA